jgi:prolyl-tRNA editing enzyme YbaK/EbsC (Cys-tRNA(Pro) deacylase)
MALEKVREYLKQWGREGDIIEISESTATVDAASQALDVIPARIAKSLSLRTRDAVIVVLTAGDVKLDNRKFKDHFGVKARMLSPEETLAETGHEVGGVCPFALPDSVAVYLDISLKRFSTVFPACGSSHSAIELTLEDLELYSHSRSWLDICKSHQWAS